MSLIQTFLRIGKMPKRGSNVLPFMIKGLETEKYINLYWYFISNDLCTFALAHVRKGSEDWQLYFQIYEDYSKLKKKSGLSWSHKKSLLDAALNNPHGKYIRFLKKEGNIFIYQIMKGYHKSKSPRSNSEFSEIFRDEIKSHQNMMDVEESISPGSDALDSEMFSFFDENISLENITDAEDNNLLEHGSHANINVADKINPNSNNPEREFIGNSYENILGSEFSKTINQHAVVNISAKNSLEDEINEPLRSSNEVYKGKPNDLPFEKFSPEMYGKISKILDGYINDSRLMLENEKFQKLDLDVFFDREKEKLAGKENKTIQIFNSSDLATSGALNRSIDISKIDHSYCNTSMGNQIISDNSEHQMNNQIIPGNSEHQMNNQVIPGNSEHQMNIPIGEQYSGNLPNHNSFQFVCNDNMAHNNPLDNQVSSEVLVGSQGEYKLIIHSLPNNQISFEIICDQQFVDTAFVNKLVEFLTNVKK